MRLSDLHTQEYMAGMMRASDIGSFAGYAEGFCVPAEEFKACGTPIVATRAGALAEREAAWWCESQPFWSKLHNRWWRMPLVSSLVQCYEQAYREARKPGDAGPRKLAAKSASRYRAEHVIPMWDAVLQAQG
jgi:glycosyltransferase involved in cell wall biosynthesis